MDKLEQADRDTVMAMAAAVTDYANGLTNGVLTLADLISPPEDIDLSTVKTLLMIKQVRINVIIARIDEIKKTQLTDEDNRA